VVMESLVAVIYNALWSWNEFWLLFTMFCARGINFGCYLQGFVLMESIFAVIYNVLLSWNQFWLLFTMFCAPGIGILSAYI